MTKDRIELIGSAFKDTSEVPKDRDIFYHCLKCDSMIPSVPRDSIGCDCGNIFIDKDYWRLIVADMKALEVVRKKRA